jgi:predicted DNA-binding protein
MLRIRLTEEQRQRLEQLAKSDGDVTLSNYCRKKLFESLSTELKLNKILELLNTKKAK